MLIHNSSFDPIFFENDEQIRGNSNFVESLVEGQKNQMKRCHLFQKHGYVFETAIDRVAEVFSLTPEHVIISAQQHQRITARGLLYYWAVKELEMRGADMANRLEMSKSTGTRTVVYREKIALSRQVKFIKCWNRRKSTFSYGT